MNYRVISTCDITSFNRQIEDLINEGWIIHGSLSTAAQKEDGELVIYYSQALTRPKQHKQDPNQTKLL